MSRGRITWFRKLDTGLTPAFRFQIDTEKAGSGTTVFIAPVIVGTAGLTGTMNWGDGNSTFLDNTSIAADFEHDYGVGNEGVYDCFFVGDLKGWQFNNLGDKEKITKLTDWTGFFLSLRAFYGCVNLVITATTIPTTLGNTLQFAFRNNMSIGSPDFSAWNVSGIVVMSSVFRDCGDCGVNISGWSFSQVTNMSNFANGSKFTTINYSNLLSDTATQGVLNVTTAHFGTSLYNAGAVTDRATVITNGWTIIDGGLEP